MQKSACRFSSHARIAVSCSADNAFEQTEYAAHPRQVVQRRNQVYFRSARIREASVNPTGNQRAD
jgi:hypothetical protein